MKRQLDDYYTKFYNKEAERFKALAAADYHDAKEIAAWKETVASRWDSISVLSVEMSDNLKSGQLVSGTEIEARVTIDEQGLDNAVGVDLVVVSADESTKDKFQNSIPLTLTEKDGNRYTFTLKYMINFIGRVKTSFRMYPSNRKLPHRQDFCYVRWF